MAGRIDEGTQQAALTNVSEAGIHADEFRRLLEKILSSSAFRGSHRSKELLRHLVELALRGEPESLKERIIGVEVFKRDANFDTSGDSIVRVCARDVRRRLNLFYAEYPSERFRINLVLGSYIPEFLQVRYQDPPAVETPPPNARSLEFSIATALPSIIRAEGAKQTVASGETLEHDAGAGTVVQPVAARYGPSKLGALGVCAVVVLFSAGWLASAYSVRSEPTRLGNASELHKYSFYKELMGPMITDSQMGTEIVFSNPKLFLYRGSKEPNPNEGAGEMKFPLPPAMAKELAEGANDTQADFPFRRLVLDTYDYTGLGEAKAAFGLGTLMEALGRPSHLSESRFLNWDVARSEHVVVLGAPHMSKWAQDSLAHADFTMEHDSIRNSHPLRGEQSVYERTSSGDLLVDYGLIWMSRSPSGARILVLAGITSTGTAGVGSFFADPDSMRPLFEQLRNSSNPGAFPDNWQVLLRITARENVPIKVEPVTIRINPDNNN
jgi:hypothetical protein